MRLVLQRVLSASVSVPRSSLAPAAEAGTASITHAHTHTGADRAVGSSRAHTESATPTHSAAAAEAASRTEECSGAEEDRVVVGSIGKGLLALVGMHSDDTEPDFEYIIKALRHTRLWACAHTGKAWAESAASLGLPILLVSQFTLYANTKKAKPDFHRAMASEAAGPGFAHLLQRLRSVHGQELVAAGHFGAMMHVALVNDGPVTVIVDSKNRDDVLPTPKERPTPTPTPKELRARAFAGKRGGTGTSSADAAASTPAVARIDAPAAGDCWGPSSDSSAREGAEAT